MFEGKLLKAAGLGVLGGAERLRSRRTGMVYDRARLYTTGGAASNERTLGTLEVKRFQGSAAIDI